jgi:hypothetical protein
MIVVDAPVAGVADAVEAMSSPERRHRATQHHRMSCHFWFLAFWLLAICSFPADIVNPQIGLD